MLHHLHHRSCSGWNVGIVGISVTVVSPAYYKSSQQLREENSQRGKSTLSIFSCAFFPLLIRLITTVCLSGAALGTGLFCVSVKWSIKWGEQTVSAALSPSLPPSLTPHRSFVLSQSSVDPFNHLISLLPTEVKTAAASENDHVY